MNRLAAGVSGIAALAVAGGAVLVWFDGGGGDGGGGAAGAKRAVDAQPRSVSPLLPAPPVSAPPLPDQTQEWVTRVLARPLFSVTREPGTASGDAAERGIPRLSGIMITPLGRRVIFAGSDGGRNVVAYEGTRVGAYTVQTIGSGQVTLIGPTGRHVVRPTFEPGSPAR